MKIEIEVPLDESEWEYVGVVYPRAGDTILTLGDLIEVALDETSLYPTFRRRADKHAWKNGIKWPSVFREGTWLARDEVGAPCLYETEPSKRTAVYSDTAGNFSTLKSSIYDLSFLPSEFWECDWHDSLVQVRHGGEDEDT
jgi:hypothetical protein